MFKLIYKLLIFLLGSAIIHCLCAASLFCQTDLAKKREDYQNQQRAAYLNSLRPGIKVIEDARARCEMRIQILRFIFESRSVDYFDTANALAVECLDDTAAKTEEFSDSQWTKNEILALLRKHSPAFAVKVEKKYFQNVPGAEIFEGWDLDNGTDPNTFANRIIAKISADGVPKDLPSYINDLKELNFAAYQRVLTVVLAHWESNLSEVYSNNVILGIENNFRDESNPLPLRLRYYNLIIRLGEAAIADPENKQLTNHSIQTLRFALSDIKEIGNDIYSKAQGLYLSLTSKFSEEEKKREEIFERINASKDKLAQTISEAESVESKDLKDTLWLMASQYAINTRKYRIAAESRLKTRAQIETLKKSQYFFIKDEVLDGCLKENDTDTARYVVGLIEDLAINAEGTLKIAAKLVELKKTTEAFDKLNEGWQKLAKAENTREKWRLTRDAIKIAGRIDKTRAFDMAGDFVKAVNGLPTPNAEDKPGTEARRKYVADVLMPVSYNLAEVFRLLGKEDFALTDAIAQGVQRREWKLAAQIALETVRVYPLPPDTEMPQFKARETSRGRALQPIILKNAQMHLTANAQINRI